MAVISARLRAALTEKLFELVGDGIDPGLRTDFVLVAAHRARRTYTAITLANRFATSGTFATARNSTLGSPMTNIQGVVGVAGGVPIKYRGEVIGGVGSSGAVGGDKDELCSQAGIDAVADQLR